MYERYCEIRNQKGLKDADVARLSGITKSTFSDWKKGLYQPKREKLVKIADALRVSLEYLMNGEDVDWDPKGQTINYTISLSEEERDLLMEYRKADDTQKEMIRRILAYSDKM